jgi:hypothetical protein
MYKPIGKEKIEKIYRAVKRGVKEYHETFRLLAKDEAPKDKIGEILERFKKKFTNEIAHGGWETKKIKAFLRKELSALIEEERKRIVKEIEPLLDVANKEFSYNSAINDVILVIKNLEKK